MSEDHHHSENRKGRSAREILRRAFETIEQLGSTDTNEATGACLSHFRLRMLAATAWAKQSEAVHLRLCAVCRTNLEMIQTQLLCEEPSAPDAMTSAPFGDDAMAMRSGTDTRETVIRSYFGALRSVLAQPKSWSLGDSWFLIRELRHYADDAALLDGEVRSRLADEYADMVDRAPAAVKVVLVYGLIPFQASRAFARDLARAISARSDALAHHVMVFALVTDAVHLIKAVDPGTWQRMVIDTEPRLQSFRKQADDAIDRIVSTVGDTPLCDTRADLLRTVKTMSDALFASRDSLEAVLQLMTLRYYLATIASYARTTRPALLQFFGELRDLVMRRVQAHGAAVQLAIEACESLCIGFSNNLIPIQDPNYTVLSRHDRLLRSLALPSIRPEDLVDRREREVELLVRRVEVGREAHAGGRTVVAHDVLGIQLVRDLFRVRDHDRHRSAATFGVARSAQLEAARVGEVD
jgi:hypothetical protein